MNYLKAPLPLALASVLMFAASATAQSTPAPQAPAQTPATPASPAPASPASTSPASTSPASTSPASTNQTAPPDGPAPPKKTVKSLIFRHTKETNPGLMTPEELEQLRISKLANVNGRPYDQPSAHDFFIDYLKDSYGLPALARTSVRAAYAQGRGKPTGWGTDFPGFMQRFASAGGITAINGNVRYGMETLFHEDLRYIPCHGCHVKAKIENALLAEITARHDEDGHRFFTLTPTVADFSGPIIAHSLWYPGGADPGAGAVSARLVFATRVGGHLFQEFVLERRHKDPPLEK